MVQVGGAERRPVASVVQVGGAGGGDLLVSAVQVGGIGEGLGGDLLVSISVVQVGGAGKGDLLASVVQVGGAGGLIARPKSS